MPSDAHLVHGEHIMDVSTQNLKSNDIIIIKAGERSSCLTGVVIEGESYLNESMLTGESKPVIKNKVKM
jgi:Cu2+-exporting ATPase